MATSLRLTKRNYQILTSWLGGFPASPSALLVCAEVLMTPEVRSSFKSLVSLNKNSHAFYFLKTSKGFYLTTTEILSTQSSPRLMNWGMTSNGKCLTAKITESPRTGKECSLSDILEERPDPKYFLSDKMVKRLMGYRDTSLTPLPADTKGHKRQARTLVKVNSMHKK